MHDAPRPVLTSQRRLPPRLQQILDRRLAQPRARYQKMEEVRAPCLQEVSVADWLGSNVYERRARARAPSAGSGPTRWLKREGQGRLDVSARHVHVDKARPFMKLRLPPSPTRKRRVWRFCFRNLSNDPTSTFYEFSLADAVITNCRARGRPAVICDREVRGRTTMHERWVRTWTSPRPYGWFFACR